MRGSLVLVGAVLLAALALAEGAVRLVDHRRCLLAFSGFFWEPNRLYGWRHVPGASGWAKGCVDTRVLFETYTRINRRGLRDRDIPYERTPAYRILVLGDSYTEGLQVEMEVTYAKLLEERLGGPGRRVEVINTGCSAYGTDNALLFYEGEGRKYRPDLVVLAFDTLNDVYENSQPLTRAVGYPYEPKPYFDLERGRLVLRDFPLPEPSLGARIGGHLKRVVLQHSALARVLRTFALPRLVRLAGAAERPSRRPSIFGVLLKDYPPEWTQAWRLTRRLIRRLRDEVARDGARLAVVVLTSPHEVSEPRWQGRLFVAGLSAYAADFDRSKPTRLMSRFLRREGIPHLALLDGFRRHFRATGESGYLDWDIHWNARGHALAADLIAPWLAGNGLVGAAGGGVPPSGASR